ncbi:MAG TPA: DUF4160 domain-containing protein, partial [Balneolaceae bacterium]|nr:DUF4160 domain-containing protein [Balneolaceae bacterium]
LCAGPLALFVYYHNYDNIIISMAVFKETLNGIEVKIHNVDHPPPHCHAYIDAKKDLKINLLTMEIMNPPPNNIPSKINKALKDRHEELLEAWEKVKVIPPGKNPGEW